MKCSCPNCHRSLQLDQPLPTQVHCPHCNATFLMDAATAASLAQAPPTMSMRPVAQDATKTGTMYPIAKGLAAPTAPVSRAAVVGRPAAKTARRLPPWVIGATIGGFALFVLAGIAIAIYCFNADAFNQKPPENAGVKPPPQGHQDLEKPVLPPRQGDEKKDKKISPKDKTNPADNLQKTKEKEKEKEKEVELPPEIVKTKEPESPPKLQVKVIETVTRKEVKRELRLAVSTPLFDDMGKLLKSLGKGYNRFMQLTEEELEDFEELKQFDVVFLTCKRSSAQNLRLIDSLRRFVEDGGTLYASDLRFDALRGAFPDYIESPKGREGDKQKVRVSVVDPGLQEILGDKVELHFDSAGWKPATFKRDKVTTIMEGLYRPFDKTLGKKFFEPLLVKFTFGKGSVIFTSFHNSKQNSEVEEKLLRYLVLTAVTSLEETRVATTMISGGFSPQPVRRLSTSDDAPSATHTYHNKKASRLQFALGFNNVGAKLRLELIAPNGQKVVQEGTASFVVELDNAAVGDWRYTVTALRVPYPNFPFTLAVGEAVPK